MKRIVASVGLAAFGAASIQGVYGQTLSSPDNARAWDVSVALRGFYDDNVATVPSGPGKISSYGFEVSPTLSYAMQLEQATEIALAYSYSYKYFDKRPPTTLDHSANTHTFNGMLDHSFSDRLQMNVQDSFVVGQEADVLAIASGPMTSPQRIPGNNIRNYGAISLGGHLTPLFGLKGGYANSLFHYADNLINGPLLNRMEHDAHLDARWDLQPDTVGLIGYRFGLVDYTSNSDDVNGTGIASHQRNNRSHYGYLGAEHNFLPNLFAAAQAGVRYTENYNAPNHKSEVAPYAKGNVRYTYAKESFADIGATYDRSAPDSLSVNPFNPDDITRDSDTAVVYGSIRHRILPDLYGRVTGTFQHSTYNGGEIDGKVDKIYLVGLNLEYNFNRYLSASVGYSYDKLDSDIPGRGFDRNRVYIGATAKY